MPCIERIDSTGISLGPGSFLPWSVLGLQKEPKLQGSGDGLNVSLCWRMSCVRVEADAAAKDCRQRRTGQWSVEVNCSRGISPCMRELPLRSGLLDLSVVLTKGAVLRLCHRQLQLAWPLSICLQHRQKNDQSAACFCEEHLELLRDRRACAKHRMPRIAEAYVSHWAVLVELEAAAVAAESTLDSKLITDACITWEPPTSRATVRRGHFILPYRLARAHKLKFRGLIRNGGETASSWLCLREAGSGRQTKSHWCGHARVIQAVVQEENGKQLVLDEDDRPLDSTSKRTLKVTFELLSPSGNSLTAPDTKILIEYLPKALSYQVMHIALAEINQAGRTDGTPAPALLARDIVLGRLPNTASADDIDLSMWNLNDHQQEAVRCALGRPLQLIHGPPGTGKTWTVAVLMTLFARRNLGTRSAVLFSSTTNRSVDSALLQTDQLCKQMFAERLRARSKDEGCCECKICMGSDPEVLTACQHAFHKDCLAKSMKTNNSCPVCSQLLRQSSGGLRLLRVYSAEVEHYDFPLPKKSAEGWSNAHLQNTVPENLRRFSLHWRCHAAVDGEEPSEEALVVRAAYKRLKCTDPDSPDFGERWSEYHTALFKARAVEIRQMDLLFTTCVSTRRNALLEALWKDSAPTIRQVVLDEAAQAVEPEALCSLALAKEAHTAVLLGDHHQLRPVVRSRAALDGGLAKSLFERLLEERRTFQGHIILLAEQYRMHPTINHFISERFYQSRITDAASVLSREDGALALPGLSSGCQRKASLIFWNMASNDDKANETEVVRTVYTRGSGNVGSRANAAEAHWAAELAIDIATELGEGRVAVLSWYGHQVANISELLKKRGQRKLHVGTVATAQGSEWDYVLLSTVRSDHGTLSNGLLSDERMINVALTRARYGLVVLGDQCTLRGDASWKSLIRYCESHMCLVSEKPQVVAKQFSVQPVASPMRSNQPAPSLLVPNSNECQAYVVSKESKFQAALVRLHKRRRGELGDKAAVDDSTSPQVSSEKGERDASPPSKRAKSKVQLQERCACGRFFNPKCHGRCSFCSAGLASYRRAVRA